ncbi:MAG: hypothetical protein ACI8P0_001099 [Planctomycetaceae bacterium]|jgi:hypothetical protein
MVATSYPLWFYWTLRAIEYWPLYPAVVFSFWMALTLVSEKRPGLSSQQLIFGIVLWLLGIIVHLSLWLPFLDG